MARVRYIYHHNLDRMSCSVLLQQGYAVSERSWYFLHIGWLHHHHCGCVSFLVIFNC